MAPSIREGFRVLGAAHMADGFPTGLSPDERAVALYVLPPNTSPVVRLTFLDEAGNRWCRTNDQDPERPER
jgi:hypothetical protein